MAVVYEFLRARFEVWPDKHQPAPGGKTGHWQGQLADEPGLPLQMKATLSPNSE